MNIARYLGLSLAKIAQFSIISTGTYTLESTVSDLGEGLNRGPEDRGPGTEDPGPRTKDPSRGPKTMRMS